MPAPRSSSSICNRESSDVKQSASRRRRRTDLADYLETRGGTQVMIAGIATSVGVESAARSTHEHGLNVTLAVDAMTDMSADAHDRAVAHVFPKLGEIGTTQAIIALLDGVQDGS